MLGSGGTCPQTPATGSAPCRRPPGPGNPRLSAGRGRAAGCPLPLTAVDQRLRSTEGNPMKNFSMAAASWASRGLADRGALRQRDLPALPWAPLRCDQALYEADVNLTGPLADWNAHLSVARAAYRRCAGADRRLGEPGDGQRPACVHRSLRTEQQRPGPLGSGALMCLLHGAAVGLYWLLLSAPKCAPARCLRPARHGAGVR